MRKAARWIAIVLLGLTGVLGLMNAATEVSDATTKLQSSVTFAVALYGVFGLLGAVGLIRRRPWSVTVAAAWTLAIMYAGSVASFAFHDPTFQQKGTLAGVLASGIFCALIGGFVIWAARASISVDAPVR